jgi:hypothetical protein
MLIGINCQFNGKITFEECLACANTTSNPCQFTEYIIKQMFSYNEPRTGLSVTALLGCHRKVYLERTLDYYEPLEWLWFRFRGHLLHAIAEHATQNNPDFITERRFSKEICGVEISGKPDIINVRHNLLQDLKTCAAIPKYDQPYNNHGLQVNTYRYIIQPEIKIDRLEIIYMSMKDVKKLSCKVIEPADVEKRLKPHIECLSEAFVKALTPGKCDEDGEWQCDWCGGKEHCRNVEKTQLHEQVKQEIREEVIKDLRVEIRKELEEARKKKKGPQELLML